MTNTTEKRVEKLWKKFKSVLGNSSIDNKRNSMYDLEDFLIDSIAQAIAEERERAVEVLAEHIYNQMPHKTTGKKPRWVVNGNSLKQDEARTIARIVLSPLNSFK